MRKVLDINQWIKEHRHDDVNELALHAAHDPDTDMRAALVQIRGWQIAEKKLPLWAQTEGIVFPEHLPLEQCSSQLTAEYKASLVRANDNGNNHLHSMTDLTGGFGVDAVMMGRWFQHLTYVEQRADLCDLARHNFPLLGLKDFEVVHADCTDMLNHLPHQNLVLIDPARRDANGRKTVAINDCKPDVCALNQQLLAVADVVMIKLSPMLDIASAERQLEGVKEIHVVSVGGECKEILIVLQGLAMGAPFRQAQGVPIRQARGVPIRQAQGVEQLVAPVIHCVNITSDGIPSAGSGCTHSTSSGCTHSTGSECTHSTGSECTHSTSSGCTQRFSFTHAQEQEAQCIYTNEVGRYLYEPNASLMKACPFRLLAQHYQLEKLHPNSHLYTSPNRIEDFPGRRFRVNDVLPVNKQTIKQISQLQQANISVRNFPASVAELRRRFRLADGGSAYLVATTLADGRKVVLVMERDV